MSFNFIPFKLNDDLSQYKDQIKYISSDNGVELYKVRNGLKIEILGILVSDVNLYFFEGNLITIYIHLNESPDHIERVKEIFEKEIKTKERALKIESGLLYCWTSENSFLGLLSSSGESKMKVYVSIDVFNIYTK